MSKLLHIGEGLALPKDVVTSTLIVYGGKGMGKTNFGSVLVEELTKAGLRWAVLDPIGVWWGLRHSKDGKGPGIECLILGGTHGDIPIEPTGGSVAADLVADEQVNVLIDFSRKPSGEMWGVGEKTRFVTEYASRLFQRQGELISGHRREPLFQILDEAARYIPQMLPAGNPELARCLSAWNMVVEEGRNIGLGVGLLTQRSARMNKSVSELADAMIAFRTVGPNSIDAIMDWMGEHVAKSRIKELVEQIRALDRGTCMVVSPGWLKFEGTVAIRERETFDSSATPKPGERDRRVSGAAAKPDLNKYLERMKATIERVKADDPKELKKKIAELQKQIAKPNPSLVQRDSKSADNKRQSQVIKSLKSGIEAAMKIIAAINAKGFDKVGLGKEEIEKALQQASAEIVKLVESQIKRRGAEFDKLKAEAERVLARLQQLANDEEIKVNLDVTHNEPFTLTSRPVSAKPRTNVVQFKGDVELTGPERKILKALGELFSIGKEQAPKNMVAAWSGYSPLGGAFGNPIGALRSKGLIDYPQPGIVVLTDAGRSVVGPCDVPDRDEIWRRIESTCTGPERKILRALIDNAGQDEIAKEQLAEKAGYSPVGGAFGNPIGALRTKGLLDYPRQGVVKAADWLFAA